MLLNSVGHAIRKRTFDLTMTILHTFLLTRYISAFHTHNNILQIFIVLLLFDHLSVYLFLSVFDKQNSTIQTVTMLTML